MNIDAYLQELQELPDLKIIIGKEQLFKALRKLYRDFFNEDAEKWGTYPFSRKVWEEELNFIKTENRSRIFGANYKGEFVGYANTDNFLGASHIFHLFVVKKFRNMGIGKRLVSACIETAKKDGYKVSIIHIIKKNFSAVRFYKELGFEATGVEYKRNGVTIVEYKKRIKKFLGVL